METQTYIIAGKISLMRGETMYFNMKFGHELIGAY